MLLYQVLFQLEPASADAHMQQIMKYQMIALDRFATPALYRAIEPRLVASYLPAENDQPPQVARELRPADVRRLANASVESRTAAGAEYLRPLDDYNSDRD